MKKLQRQSATAKQTGQGQANHFWREPRSYATRPNKYHVTFSNENIFYRMKIFLPNENISLNENYFYRIKIFFSITMKIYFIEWKYIFYRIKIFFQMKIYFYRMQIYFYQMKIIFIEFCYISATILSVVELFKPDIARVFTGDVYLGFVLTLLK